MGTNFYWYEKPKCECCKRGYDGTHIGKSSWGWRFALHVTDEIRNLKDWEMMFSKPGSYIENEYGDVIPVDEMLRTIRREGWDMPAMNRSQVDGRHCIGHGDGLYDLCRGEFS